MPPSPFAVGLDVGTTWVKAALWRAGADGRHPLRGPPVTTIRLPLPPLQSWRGLPVQGAEALACTVEAALAALAEASELQGPGIPRIPGGDQASAGAGGGARIDVAFTTQRDTLLLVDDRGDPVTPLLSWRERRHLEDPASRKRLLAADRTPSAGAPSSPAASPPRPLSLEQWLLERWQAGLRCPGFEGARIRYAGGDKNCEYLALGADLHTPARAVISLGSAITLGVAVPGEEPPVAISGTVVSAMAGTRAATAPGGVKHLGRPEGLGRQGRPGWNVETGILSGMQGLEQAAAAAGMEAWEGPIPELPEADWVCVPWFGGAVDDPKARGEVRASPGTVNPLPLTPPRLARAWAQGVAGELARLAPRVQEVSGTRIREVRVTGGGTARGPRTWERLLASALRVPVRVVHDPWAGCRGAVMALSRSPGGNPPVGAG